MPTQMKRPAAAVTKKAAEPKAKAAKVDKPKEPEDPFVVKCDAIVSVLLGAEGFPEATLHMLANTVKFCLSVPKQERHAVVGSVIEMIEEVMTSVEDSHAAKLAALRGKIAEADAEKVNREATAEASKADAQEKKDGVDTAEKALDEAVAGAATARGDVDIATAEQKTGDRDLLSAESKKASAENLATNDLAALKSGTASDKAASMKSFSKVGKDLGLETQLLSSAEAAFGKAPAERGGFDAMVVQQVDEQLTSTIAKLEALLASGEAGKAERAAKVEAAKEKAEAAAGHALACGEKLQAAKAALEEAEAASAAAAKSVEDFGPDMEEAAANAEAADAVLVACKADLTTLRELMEGPTPEPEAAAEAPDASENKAPEADAEA